MGAATAIVAMTTSRRPTALILGCCELSDGLVVREGRNEANKMD